MKTQDVVRYDGDLWVVREIRQVTVTLSRVDKWCNVQEVRVMRDRLKPARAALQESFVFDETRDKGPSLAFAS